MTELRAGPNIRSDLQALSPTEPNKNLPCAGGRRASCQCVLWRGHADTGTAQEDTASTEWTAGGDREGPMEGDREGFLEKVVPKWSLRKILKTNQ